MEENTGGGELGEESETGESEPIGESFLRRRGGGGGGIGLLLEKEMFCWWV